MPELIALARAKPGVINYASAGIGSTSHFAGELLKRNANIDLTHIAYKGSATLVAVVVGESSLLFTGPLSALPHVRAGRMKLLAISSANRSPSFPDVPTVREGGVPGYEYVSWYGIFAPRGTPSPIVNRFSSAVAEVMAKPDFRDQFAGEGFQLDGKGPAVFEKFVASEIQRYSELVPTITGLKVE